MCVRRTVYAVHLNNFREIFMRRFQAHAIFIHINLIMLAATAHAHQICCYLSCSHPDNAADVFFVVVFLCVYA